MMLFIYAVLLMVAPVLLYRPLNERWLKYQRKRILRRADRMEIPCQEDVGFTVQFTALATPFNDALCWRRMSLKRATYVLDEVEQVLKFSREQAPITHVERVPAVGYSKPKVCFAPGWLLTVEKLTADIISERLFDRRLLG